MSEQYVGGIARFDRRGITHCYPHDNKMPCAECARKFKSSLNADIDQQQ